MILVALSNLPWDTYLQTGARLGPERRNHLLGDDPVAELLASGEIEHASIGGSPTNVALAWKRLAERCTVVGPTGADDYGETARRALTEAGVDLVEVLPRPARHAHSVALSGAGRERRFAATLPRVPPGAKLERDPWTEPGWTVTSTYELGDPGMARVVLEGLRRARDRDHRLAFDYADPHFVEERRRRIGDVLALRPDVVLLDRDPDDPASLAPVVLVSRGPEGVVAYAGGTTVSRPAPRVAVRDTTGAGDALLGGFLWEWAREERLEAALERGIAAAAEVLQVVGAHAPPERSR